MVGASNGTYKSALNIEPRANSSGKGFSGPSTKSSDAVCCVARDPTGKVFIELDPRESRMGHW